MNIIYAWKESLDLFRPHNFKPFIHGVFKNIVATYTVLLHYFWWLFFGSIFVYSIIWLLFFNHLIFRPGLWNNWQIILNSFLFAQVSIVFFAKTNQVSALQSSSVDTDCPIAAMVDMLCLVLISILETCVQLCIADDSMPSGMI